MKIHTPCTCRIKKTILINLILPCTVQDKEDDLRVGVKSTAILFGDQTKVWITGFGIASIITLWLSGYNASIGIINFV